MEQTLTKVVIHKAGGYDQLKIEKHPRPQPKAGEALVAIRSSGVNYADVAVRWGLYESAKKYVGWPITPGFEFAGVVEAVGAGVTKVKRGDEVFGISLFGAYSSHIVLEERLLFAKPKSFSLDEAAGFPAVFMTAYHALFQNIVVRPNMTLLIHSAAGGVGTALLQLAKIIGCKTVGVVGSTHKIESAKRFGADFVIDKSKENLWKRASEIAPDGYDVVLDANGASTLKQSFKHLKSTGKLVSYGFASMLPKKGGHVNYPKLVVDYLRTPRFNPIEMTKQNKSVITFNLSFLFDRHDLLEEGMTALLKWVEEGKIKPPQVRCYSMADVARAHEAIESGQTTGKLILNS